MTPACPHESTTLPASPPSGQSEEAAPTWQGEAGGGGGRPWCLRQISARVGEAPGTLADLARKERQSSR